jgi:DNA-directed RNA polymerase specialized sigma54-like protein
MVKNNRVFELKIEEDDLKDIITEITQLNPRPGNSENDDKNQIC